jgi:hypothetical protein
LHRRDDCTADPTAPRRAEKGQRGNDGGDCEDLRARRHAMLGELGQAQRHRAAGDERQIGAPEGFRLRRDRAQA